ncbi:MAG TPA: glycoside hydrolase family 127 protein [Niabella sp.]|nr:glycoside hydrolase family 127 protein [Niabella sp.]HOZ97865.1 glycoside hydrolase family 127 protein [Niabella sp.]HQW13724.1 glycoside hydrolase family 127 protein [Niabella sp.]HQX19119.1 glycoside hydrolase family 127 protein [Niabella sp.]HQX41281.1 glycoside hydrolase family 127 protein [Niabella sp.]
MFKNNILLFVLVLSFSVVNAQPKDYPIQPVTFTQVQVNDHFWKPKMDVNVHRSIPYILKMCREHGRIDNFLAAAGKRENKVCSDFPFDDTDIYKWIEGASYALQVQPDAKLSNYLDTIVSIIAEAQEPDGYLFTFRTMKPAKLHPWVSKERWLKDEDLSHELYNSGHLFEAAFAHYNATGKKTLLNIATKNADLLCKDFGWGEKQLKIYPGHQIIETGLAKLFRITGKQKYLDLAKFFLDVRGPKGNEYNQAHKKVIDQTEAVGHAVRAAYMYSGMADVAALTGDHNYVKAINAIWDDVVTKKLYITGGIGATNNGEAFGSAYDLPNMSAYAETCAAIANVYWNNRMFLLNGDAKYIDVLEQTLYNGLLSGMSLEGTHFFYPNPLASVGQHERSAWFSCACCISNMTRFLPSVPGYVYAQNNNDLYVNLFMSNNSHVTLAAGKVNISQQTDYPWNGKIALAINPEKKTSFSLHIRIPGWVNGQPVPGDLYFTDGKKQNIKIYLNGKPASYKLEKGYAVIQRQWKKNDKISFELPMQTQKVFANEKVKADKDRFAIQYGPVVYCLEGVDNKDSVIQNIVVDKNTPMQVVYKKDKLNGINEIKMDGKGLQRLVGDSKQSSNKQSVYAIPYYAWNNRGAGEMEVWIPYTDAASRPKPAPTIANKSKVSASIKSKSLSAINDQFEPESSRDNAASYFHWWPKTNSTEWVIYEFETPQTVTSSKVYWFDDKPWGGCSIPESWKLYYKQGKEWVPVINRSAYEIAKDKYNSVNFEPVTTSALKLEVQLSKDNSAGLHEWIVQ